MYCTALAATLISLAAAGHTHLPEEFQTLQRAWIDFDGDGDFDLFVGNPHGPDKLFRNDDGQLVDATSEVGLDGEYRLTAWEDWDGDGDVDLFAIGLAESALLEFNGIRFVDVSAQAGLLHTGRDLDATWSDPNRDGLPDLEVGQWGRTLIYENVGARAFAMTEVTVPMVAPLDGSEGSGAGESTAPVPPRNAPDGTRAEDGRRQGAGRAGSIVRPPTVHGGGGPSDVGAVSALPPLPAVSCLGSILDQATGLCVQASSDPMLGLLMPLSEDFNLDAGGRVGMGTDSPGADLHVSGGVGAVEILIEADTNNNGEEQHPTITMTQDGGNQVGQIGFFNGNNTFTMRHETAETGLQLRGDNGNFVYRNYILDQPVLDGSSTIDGGRLRVYDPNGVAKVALDLENGGGRGRFEAADATNTVVINGQFANDAGAILLRNDSGGDRLTLLGDNGNDDALIDLQGRLECTSSNVATFGPLGEFRYTGAGAGPPRLVNLERGMAQSGNDVLQIVSAAGSPSDAQFIEAELDNGDHKFRVDMDGSVYIDGLYTGPADFAEMLEVSTGADSVQPGHVVVIDPASTRAVRMSMSARSTLVAGVYSSRPGFVGSEREWDMPSASGVESRALNCDDMAELYDEVPIAVVGIVPCRVSAENGPIGIGDLLVTSSTPGHAMRDANPRTGTVVGKALGSLSAGTDVIKVLVTLH